MRTASVLVAIAMATSACTHVPDAIAPDAALRAAVSSLDIPADAVVLVGTGDIASCEEPRFAAATAVLVAAVLELAPYALVFTTGDHAYPEGTAAQFRACYAPHWGPFNARTRPTPGNHDYETPGAEGYFDYFAIFDERPESRPTGYYSFELGAWLVIALNSMLAVDPGAVQVRWLARQLERADGRCVLAFWHHPLFSSGFHGWVPWDDGRDTDAFWRVLERHGADVILNGHDHLYERFAPQDAEERPTESGMRQFTVGTGGAGLHPVIRRRANSAYVNNETYGVLALALSPSSYEWVFIGADGRIHDRSEAPVSCGAGRG